MCVFHVFHACVGDSLTAGAGSLSAFFFLSLHTGLVSLKKTSSSSSSPSLLFLLLPFYSLTGTHTDRLSGGVGHPQFTTSLVLCQQNISQTKTFFFFLRNKR